MDDTEPLIPEKWPVDDVIWSCPDCDGDLERDSYGLWCSACEQVAPWACLPADPDEDPRTRISWEHFL